MSGRDNGSWVRLAGMTDEARALAAVLAGRPDLVGAATSAFAEGRAPTEDEFRAVAALGADRARQGVPGAALLDGFQAARSAVVRRLTDMLRDRGVDGGALVDAFIALDEVITSLERRVTHAHRATELEMARTARDQRALLLRALLTDGASVDPAALRSLRVDPAGRVRCVVSAERRAEAAQRLEAELTATTPGVFGLVNGFLVGVSTQPPPDCGPLLVVSPPVALERLPRVYALCCAARDAGARRGLRGAHDLVPLALESILDTAADLGALLADTALAALDPRDRFHRELAETALAHLDHGGRVERAAAALHVHPNTVKYRLRRLRELTGHPAAPTAGRAVAETVSLWWALRTWATRGPGRAPPG